jgi:hypothetical protein
MLTGVKNKGKGRQQPCDQAASDVTTSQDVTRLRESRIPDISPVQKGIDEDTDKQSGHGSSVVDETSTTIKRIDSWIPEGRPNSLDIGQMRFEGLQNVWSGFRNMLFWTVAICAILVLLWVSGKCNASKSKTALIVESVFLRLSTKQILKVHVTR